MSGERLHTIYQRTKALKEMRHDLWLYFASVYRVENDTFNWFCFGDVCGVTKNSNVFVFLLFCWNLFALVSPLKGLLWCLFFPASSRLQEAFCSGTERLWGHRETHQIIFSYCSEKYPRQVRLTSVPCVYSSFPFPEIIKQLRFVSPLVFFPRHVVVVWPQCTESSDALPGKPREGQPAEWAGGSVIQDGAAERAADRVWGHGSETPRGCRHAEGDTCYTSQQTTATTTSIHQTGANSLITHSSGSNSWNVRF